MMRAKQFMQRSVIFLILFIVAAFMVFPLLWMLSTALKPSYQVMQFPPQLIPIPPLWENFSYLFGHFDIVRDTGNSLFLCAMNILGSLPHLLGQLREFLLHFLCER